MVVYNIPYTRMRFTFVVSSLWLIWCVALAAILGLIGSFLDSALFLTLAEEHVIASFICFGGSIISWVALVYDKTEDRDTYANIMRDKK